MSLTDNQKMGGAMLAVGVSLAVAEATGHVVLADSTLRVIIRTGALLYGGEVMARMVGLSPLGGKTSRNEEGDGK
ncbi:hypothetical protein SAMN05421858_5059 [Haladaptatus litoreus]|uniref:Uncharacterized protein n=1 Tax=Haladaptatus litoreus TaxID=553468 RepID=A0A1N7FHD1_9EURY|nr:hypothetical protein [Haladaptatus litoreus]SIR99749.1 hypothetical protein SAMN05421858_5059 [Haladaptatus litoreus]